MKKCIAWVLLVLGMLFVLTGCSSSDEQKLEVFSTKLENKDMLQSLINAYTEENPGVKIVLSSPPDAGTVLRTKLTKNRVPDVIFIGGDIAYTDIQGAEMLMDLSEEESAQRVKEAYKKQVYGLNEDKSEKLYGVPYATNAAGVVYNKEIFEKYNIEIPKTYDEFKVVCETLQENGVLPIYFTLKDSWTGANLWNVLSGSLAPHGFGEMRLANETSFLGTHEGLVERMTELTKYGQDDLLGMGYDDGNIAFSNGKAAMMIQGNWVIPNIKKSNNDIELDMFPFPGSNNIEENNIVSGIDVMIVISKATKQEALAKDFLSFVTREENVRKYIDEQFAFSALSGIDQMDKSVESLQDDFHKDKIAEFADHFYPSGFDMGAHVQGYLGKPTNLENFLKNMDKDYDKYNKKRK